MKPFLSRIALVLLVLVGCGKDSPKPASAVAPTVVTGTASEIASTSAKIGGQVTADGNAAVTSRGIVYATTIGPTTASNVVSEGTGSGAYTASLTNLLPGTTYHARAFATNSAGTSYGLDITFMTVVGMPTVNTRPVIDILSTSAVAGGEVLSDGGAPITARGVCWGTTASPTIAGNKTSDGSGTGPFVSLISNLIPGTTYYVRAYATNSAGTSYGSDITFVTLAVLPTLTTVTLTTISNTSANSGGNITSDGGGIITARGVCWSTTTIPTIANSKTTDGTGAGLFTSAMTGLTPSTTYYVRAYATNSAGTAYGQQLSFVTRCVPTLEGNVSYVTVVTAAVVPITPCLPSVSGTTTLSVISPGIYAIGDASFGQYGCAWSDNPAIGVKWEVNCSNHMVTTGADQYSLLWSYVIISNNGTTLVISWSSSYGDAGTTSLTRVGGWPLNLSF